MRKIFALCSLFVLFHTAYAFSNERDSQLVGIWAEVYANSDPSGATSGGERYRFAFLSDGTWGMGTGAKYFSYGGYISRTPAGEITLLGTWQTQGNLLILSGTGGSRTGTYYVEGERMLLESPDGSRSLLYRR